MNYFGGQLEVDPIVKDHIRIRNIMLKDTKELLSIGLNAKEIAQVLDIPMYTSKYYIRLAKMTVNELAEELGVPASSVEYCTKVVESCLNVSSFIESDILIDILKRRIK